MAFMLTMLALGASMETFAQAYLDKEVTVIGKELTYVGYSQHGVTPMIVDEEVVFIKDGFFSKKITLSTDNILIAVEVLFVENDTLIVTLENIWTGRLPGSGTFSTVSVIRKYNQNGALMGSYNKPLLNSVQSFAGANDSTFFLNVPSSPDENNLPTGFVSVREEDGSPLLNTREDFIEKSNGSLVFDQNFLSHQYKGVFLKNPLFLGDQKILSRQSISEGSVFSLIQNGSIKQSFLCNGVGQMIYDSNFYVQTRDSNLVLDETFNIVSSEKSFLNPVIVSGWEYYYSSHDHFYDFRLENQHLTIARQDEIGLVNVNDPSSLETYRNELSYWLGKNSQWISYEEAPIIFRNGNKIIVFVEYKSSKELQFGDFVFPNTENEKTFISFSYQFKRFEIQAVKNGIATVHQESKLDEHGDIVLVSGSMAKVIEIPENFELSQLNLSQFLLYDENITHHSEGQIETDRYGNKRFHVLCYQQNFVSGSNASFYVYIKTTKCSLPIPKILASHDTLYLETSGGVDFEIRWLVKKVENEPNNTTSSVSIIPGATNSWFVPTEDGDYAVEIFSGNCYKTSEFHHVDLYTDGANTFNLNGLKVYPNPVEQGSDLLIETNQEITKPVLISYTGEVFKLTPETVSFETYKLSLEGLPSGMYILDLSNYRKKITIQ